MDFYKTSKQAKWWIKEMLNTEKTTEDIYERISRDYGFGRKFVDNKLAELKIETIGKRNRAKEAKEKMTRWMEETKKERKENAILAEKEERENEKERLTRLSNEIKKLKQKAKEANQ